MSQEGRRVKAALFYYKGTRVAKCLLAAFTLYERIGADCNAGYQA